MEVKGTIGSFMDPLSFLKELCNVSNKFEKCKQVIQSYALGQKKVLFQQLKQCTDILGICQLMSEYYDDQFACCDQDEEFNDYGGVSYTIYYCNNYLARNFQLNYSENWFSFYIFESEKRKKGIQFSLEEDLNSSYYTVYNYQDNKVCGPAISVFGNEQIYEKGTYINDIREGESLHYNKNGTLWYKENFVNGRIHGKRIVYFESGRIQEEDDYENGFKRKEMEFYDIEPPNIKEERYYNDTGSVVSENRQWYSYDQKGNKIMETNWSKFQPFIITREFYLSGNLKSVVTCYHGWTLHKKIYEEDGEYIGKLIYNHLLDVGGISWLTRYPDIED